MTKPAGAQIRRWFVLLVCLLLIVAVASMAGTWYIFQSVRGVADRAAPLAAATAALRHEIVSAQGDLFRYLAELSDDVSPALRHLAEVDRLLDESRQAAATPEVTAELDEIGTRARQYRMVLELLPRSVGETKDWSRLQEYSQKSVELGNEMEERAVGLAREAQGDILRRSGVASRTAAAAMAVAAGALVICALAVLAPLRWWKRFQDQILGL